MALPLVDLVVLARVLERGSFAKAAADFGVPASTLSRRVAALEKRVGVRVLERTTRSLRATELGELLAERGSRVREALDDAERVVADHQRAPRGLLRVSAPTPLAEDFLGPATAEYLRRYPDMRIEVIGEDRYVDLVAEGFDAAIRIGTLPASGLGAVRLAVVSEALVASRAYLARAPRLEHPRDLANHVTIGFGKRRKRTWSFVGRGGVVETVEVVPRAVSNSMRLVAELVAAGIGLAMIPRHVARAVGAEVLEPGGFRTKTIDLSIVMPSARPAPKVRAFIAVMQEFVAARPAMFEAIPRKAA